MKLKVVSVAVVVLILSALSAIEVTAQVHDASVLWLKVYGQPPAVANLSFGARLTNSFGLDTSALFPTAFREQEPPPPPPGFDCIWARVRTGQFGTYRGLLDRDFRAWSSSAQKDTFVVKFQQNDNPSADIAFKWPSAAYFTAHHVSAASFKYNDPDLGTAVIIDMLAQDSTTILAAGDAGGGVGILQATIYITGLDTVDTGVDLVDPAVPGSFHLNQNYPNPFNPTTTITFDIQKLSLTDISVYNILGQKVATLVSSVLSPGVYSTQWNGSNDFGTPLASGMYFARMNAHVEGTGESFTALRKLLLMK
jgi:hypothetical protein